MKLTKDYFLTDDVVAVARDLIGKSLFTMVDGQLAGGVICETEAYKGTADRASHAFGGRRTKRNEMMYREGGVTYVYLCYGMHHLLNFVTNAADIPDAVLIRGIVPTHGTELMLRRTGKRKVTPDIGIGPGKVSKLLGLTVADNGLSLCGEKLWIEDRGLVVPDNAILVTPRIGVDYAGEDAKRLYRFVLSIEQANPRHPAY
ncbi:MAG: DNA-3-methyladenine glycosylase [Bacteroidales bacterium]|nr:DNA-3-methyladenine glycosylase [Bacteroidales bacterium]